MDWVIYILAAIGAAYIAYRLIWPVIWCALYATGYLVFLVRAARASDPKWAIDWRPIPKLWWRKWIEAAVSPASSVKIGRLKWEPFFKFKGFHK